MTKPTDEVSEGTKIDEEPKLTEETLEDLTTSEGQADEIKGGTLGKHQQGSEDADYAGA